MKKRWYFSPDSSIGDDFSDHGTETFKNNNDGAEKFKKFAREMVQNSIDVKDENIKDPLVVRFEFSDVPFSYLPDFKELKSHIEGTIAYCESKNKHNNAYNISKRELKVFDKDTIKVLKISDYNTKGIMGSKNLDSDKSFWSGLIYNEGDSVKLTNDALGNHGLGKGAAFAMSNLRTVFYNTKDIDGNRAMEGVTRQYVSYVGGKKETHKGYYGKVDGINVKPFVDDEINEFSRLFERTSNGSDIIVLEPDVSYISETTVKWHLIESIISNFLVAIRDGNLEVIVNETEVNQANIEDVLRSLNTFYENNGIEKSDSLIATEQFLDALNNGEHIVENVKDYGEINLWLYKDKNTKWKNVAIIRKNGMHIKNLDVRYANQKFAGVVIVTGLNGVEFLRSIEDPSHLDFDPSRATDEKYGTTEDKAKRLNNFYDWIKAKAREFTKIISEDKFTLSGMEDYIQMPSNEEKKYDPKDMEPKIIKVKPKKQTKARVAKKTSVEKIDDGVVQVIPEGHSSGNTEVPNPNPKEHQTQIENKDSKKKGFVKTYVASYEMGPVFNIKDNESVLVFEITESDKDFKLKLCAVDEDGKENGLLPSAISALDMNSGEYLQTNRHIISGIKCNGVMKIKIIFDEPIRSCVKPVIYWEK